MADTDDVVQEEEQTDEAAPRLKTVMIESRFLFVDVAAMRAKQLRRGATPRLSPDDEHADEHRAQPFKAERVAMEEVRRGLVLYDVPGTPRLGDPH